MKEVNPDTLAKAEELFITLVGDVLQIISDGYGEEYATYLMEEIGMEKAPDEDEPGKEAMEFMQFLEALFKMKQ